jgi:hypothetical protein
METDNTKWYGISEKRIKSENSDLYSQIIELFDIDIPFNQKFYLYENKIKELPVCKNCDNPVKFIDMKNGFRDYCSRRCMLDDPKIKEKRKKTSIEKWGVDNPSKSNEIKKKVKDTNKEKFGYEYPLQNPEILNKTKEYFIDKFGVDNPSKSEEVKQKRESTFNELWGGHPSKSDEIKAKTKDHFIQKFGVDNPSKSEEVKQKRESTYFLKFRGHPMKLDFYKEKSKKTNLEKWGSEHFTQTEFYKKMIDDISLDKNREKVNSEVLELLNFDQTEYHIFCKKCNSDFNIQRQLYLKRERCGEEICTNCNKITKSTSKQEKEILDFLKSIYLGEILENKKIEGKELDIYLPESNIGIEFNGLYWHSELQKNKNYHIEKKNHFLKLGITLFQIWEDDWLYKSEIVKEMIKNRIGMSNKIWARKCGVKIIENNGDVREFLESNHIQGFVGSSVKLGLYYNDELVSIMTFGKLRISMGQKSKDNNWELLRFCNLKGNSVVGGASKLLNYFIKWFNPEKIITYSLNSYSDGNLYNKIGFELTGETGPNYFWCKDKIRNYRFNFRKDKLVSSGYDPAKTESEIMRERGYFKVWDAGSKKWELEIKKPSN